MDWVSELVERHIKGRVADLFAIQSDAIEAIIGLKLEGKPHEIGFRKVQEGPHDGGRVEGDLFQRNDAERNSA